MCEVAKAASVTDVRQSDGRRDTRARSTRALYLLIMATEAVVTSSYFMLVGLVALGEASGGGAEDGGGAGSLVAACCYAAFWEIVTGIYADTLSRRKSILTSFLAYALGSACFVIVAIGHSLVLWHAGLFLMSVGRALMSGAAEAWLHDRLLHITGERPELVSIYADEYRYCFISAAISFAIGIFIFVRFGASVHMASVGVYGTIVGVGVWGLSLRVLKEEYWNGRAKHPERRVAKRQIVLAGEMLRQERVVKGILGYSMVYALVMLVSFTMWNRLVALMAAKNAGDATLAGGWVYVGLYLVAAIAGPALCKRMGLTVAGEEETKRNREQRLSGVMIAGVASACAIGGMAATKSATLFLMLSMVYRVCIVPLLSGARASLQRCIPHGEHRATIISVAAGVSYVECALLFAITEQIGCGLPWAWFGAGISGVCGCVLLGER